MATNLSASFPRFIAAALLALGCLAGPLHAACAQAGTGFGSPPPGRIPILLNDRHVYVRPTKLEAGRVLGAIARGGSLLVPARSLFEAMGPLDGRPVVAYDPATHTLRVSKSGAEVVVRAGERKVVINGETRPLDVPPQLVDGVLYVPIRVISEGLGAYVSWVPQQRVVAIRYVESLAIPPSVPATSAPSATPQPSPAPTAAPPRPSIAYVRFVAADLSLAPRVANEFTPHLTGRTTQSIRVAFEYKITPPKFLGGFGRGRSFVEGEYQRYAYPHDGGPFPFPQGTPCSPRGGLEPSSGNPGCVTPIGGIGSAYANAAILTEEEFALHSSVYGIGHTYISTGLFARRNKYGYPTLRSNFGIGIERLPDPSRLASLYGSAYYYPEVTGNYSPPGGTQQRLRYKLFTYRFGGTLSLPRTPIFLDAGYIASHYIGKQNAPSDSTYGAIQIGIGLHF